jgi:type III pantothenate kinase
MKTVDIDIGNTRCKWRIREEGVELMRGLFTHHSGLSVPGLLPISVDQAYIASVADERCTKAVMRSLLSIDVQVVILKAKKTFAGLTNSYENPGRMGVDRWLAMLAAYHRDGACVVVSCGSAVTIDFVTDEGVHAGGYIVPGMWMLRSSLGQATAGVGEHQHQVDVLSPGVSTDQAVTRGTLLMIVGFIEKACREFNAANKRKKPSPLLFTGGDGELVRKFVDIPSEYVSDLVLDGIQLVASH